MKRTLLTLAALLLGPPSGLRADDARTFISTGSAPGASLAAASANGTTYAATRSRTSGGLLPLTEAVGFATGPSGSFLSSSFGFRTADQRIQAHTFSLGIGPKGSSFSNGWAESADPDTHRAQAGGVVGVGPKGLIGSAQAGGQSGPLGRVNTSTSAQTGPSLPRAILNVPLIR